mmetsp:Transcript_62213/g.157152  ORF Transcript_62213/g.157152 Transcript_62213/m.157152 type:complete len:389 (-) Transcript_62213:74-1240(-)
MVVAQIVRIRNNTLRTFHVKAGDPFYTPSIDGIPCVDGFILVTPGFDQIAEGLSVPWEAITRDGLEISEVDTMQILRCIVGPVEVDGDAHDWLQYRTRDWDPVSQGRWVALGQRHLLGAMGGAVEIQLTFRDARGDVSDGLPDLSEIVHFEYASKCSPPNTVFLNVFDLASAMSVPNAMLCNTVFNTFGAFHAAVEVYGEEWAFYRTPNPTSCGVCKSLRPRQHPVHVYRQSIPLGATTLKDWEVRYLIRGKLATKWPGGAYDLLHRNCIHFCDELSLCLGVKGVPSWVRALHETGGTLLRIPWPFSVLFSGGSIDKPSALMDEDVAVGEFEQVETASVAPSEETTLASITGGGGSASVDVAAGRLPSGGSGMGTFRRGFAFSSPRDR